MSRAGEGRGGSCKLIIANGGGNILSLSLVVVDPMITCINKVFICTGLSEQESLKSGSRLFAESGSGLGIGIHLFGTKLANI
jgi:hypothetical protein